MNACFVSFHSSAEAFGYAASLQPFFLPVRLPRRLPKCRVTSEIRGHSIVTILLRTPLGTELYPDGAGKGRAQHSTQGLCISRDHDTHRTTATILNCVA